MPTDIIMPQLGESIAEGTVVEWLVPVGGVIEKDQSLLEVETERLRWNFSPATGLLSEIVVRGKVRRFLLGLCWHGSRALLPPK